MLPSMRQRLIIAAAIAVGVLGWFAVRGMILPADGSRGLSLMDARAGLPMAVGLVLLAGVPAMIVGIVASATGNLLSGVFAAAIALCALAGATGPIDEWMWRSRLPADYRNLIIEMLIWQAMWVVMLVVIEYFRSPLRTHLPALAFTDHLGVDTKIRFPQTQALLAGVVSAVVGGLGCWLFIRSSDPGQVIGAMIVAFTVGGLLGQLLAPQTNPIGILLSPAVVAVASYVWVMYQYNGNDAVLQAWYTRRFFAPALGLPIYYASAGVAGCALGVGLAQAMISGNTDPKDLARFERMAPGAGAVGAIAGQLAERARRIEAERKAKEESERSQNP